MRSVLVALFAGLSWGIELEAEFAAFEAKFNKKYASDDERAARMKVFESNLILANKRNSENIAAGGTAVHGPTRFSDLTPEEFRSRFLSKIEGAPSLMDRGEGFVGALGAIDWRTKNAVTDVENEGQCGATWAFAVKESIESYAVIEAGKPLVLLSAQQIVSCDKVDAGCNGGEPTSAFDYVIKAGGLQSDADYPYKSGSGTVAPCKFDKTKVVVTIQNYTSMPKGEKNLHDVVTNGPPAACVAAESWQTYTGGVMTTCKGDMDHCVQVVGYDDDFNPPYWLIRNQWSTEWGEKGYARIKQGADLCLISDLVTYPGF